MGFALTYHELAVTVAAMTELTFLSADQYHMSVMTESTAVLRNLVFYNYVQLSDDSHYTNTKV